MVTIVLFFTYGPRIYPDILFRETCYYKRLFVYLSEMGLEHVPLCVVIVVIVVVAVVAVVVVVVVIVVALVVVVAVFVRNGP